MILLLGFVLEASYKQPFSISLPKRIRESPFTFDLSYTILDHLSSSCLYWQQHTDPTGI